MTFIILVVVILCAWSGVGPLGDLLKPAKRELVSSRHVGYSGGYQVCFTVTRKGESETRTCRIYPGTFWYYAETHYPASTPDMEFCNDVWIAALDAERDRRGKAR